MVELEKNVRSAAIVCRDTILIFFLCISYFVSHLFCISFVLHLICFMSHLFCILNILNVIYSVSYLFYISLRNSSIPCFTYSISQDLDYFSTLWFFLKFKAYLWNNHILQKLKCGQKDVNSVKSTSYILKFFIKSDRQFTYSLMRFLFDILTCYRVRETFTCIGIYLTNCFIIEFGSDL